MCFGTPGQIQINIRGRGSVHAKKSETKSDKSDFRNIVPRFTGENRKANQALVDLLGKIAKRKKATSAQIALAWLLAQKPWIVPTKLHRLEENIGAATVEITPEDLRKLESAASKIAIQGARYPEELEKRTGAEQRNATEVHHASWHSGVRGLGIRPAELQKSDCLLPLQRKGDKEKPVVTSSPFSSVRFVRE